MNLRFSIGLVIGKTPVLGVVYQPTSQKLYYAAEGLGAFLVQACGHSQSPCMFLPKPWHHG